MLKRDVLMFEALRQEQQRFIVEAGASVRKPRPLQPDEVLQSARPSYGRQLEDGFSMLANE